MGRILEVARESERRISILRSLKFVRRSLKASIFKRTEKCKNSKLFKACKVLISGLVLYGLPVLCILLVLFGLGLPLNMMLDLVPEPGLLRETIVDLGFFIGVLTLSILLLVVLTGLVWSLHKGLLKTLLVLVGLGALYIMFGLGFDFVFKQVVGREFDLGLLRENVVPSIIKFDSFLVEVLQLPPSTAKVEPFLGVLILLLILFLILLVPLLVVLSGFVYSLRRMFRLDWSLYEVWKKRRAEFLKGLIPPLLFSLALAVLASVIIGLIRYVGAGLFGTSSMPGLIAITVGLFVAFGIPWLLPATWRITESLWWRLSFGGSTAARMLRDHAIKDFRLSIRQRETDEGFQYPIAFLHALIARIFEFPYLHCDSKRVKDEKEQLASNNAIKKLNEEWECGGAPELLRDYVDDIMKSSKGMDERQRLRARCAVASVKYLLGDIREANELAIKNWQLANKLEADARKKSIPYRLREWWLHSANKLEGDAKNKRDESEPEWRTSVPKWWASYAYFNTESLLGKGELEAAMKRMAEYWDEYYVSRSEEEREEIVQELRGDLVVNPVPFIPRRLILTAAFNGGPIADVFKGSPADKKKYWPGVARDSEGELKKEFDQLDPKDLESEWKWVECWYEEAQTICKNTDDKIALALTHAYVGFYCTLLCLDRRCDGITCQNFKTRANLKTREKEILDSIEEGGPPITRYLRSGFYGIYKLGIEDKPEEALEDFRKAAQYSDISGNKSPSIDCLFMCCRAVAAQRTKKPALELEADRYLKEAGKVAAEIGSRFFFDLYDAARFEVSRLRGDEGQTGRIDAKLRRIDKKLRKRDPAGERILRVFRTDELRQTPWLSRLIQAPRSMILRLQNGKRRPNGSLDDTIKELNTRWKSGGAPELLRDYVDDIMKSSKGMDERQRLRARCAVASVKYLLGDIREANVLAIKNWQHANKLQADARNERQEKQRAGDEPGPEWRTSVPKWWASYAYFNTKSLLGNFETAMEGMIEYWDKYYVSLSEEEQNEATLELQGDLVVNPVTCIPRHLILSAVFNESPPAAAFEGSPPEKKKYWPGVARDSEGELKKEFDQLDPNDLISELKWVECWYEKAKEICKKAGEIEEIGTDSLIPLDFSRAYAGFYFTLLCLDRQGAKNNMARRLSRKADDAFRAMKAEDVPVQYVKSGFYGVYKLVIKDQPEDALKDFREAARYSGASGNKFAIVDCLFMCCHAVAAQRSEPPLDLEADSFLEEAGKVAEKNESGFHLNLYDAARSEVSRLRGDEGQTQRIDAKLRRGQAGERILRVFRKDFRKHER